MGWNSFTPLEKDLDNNILHTLFTYDLLGDKVITAQCTKVVSFQGVEKIISCSAQKEITLEAPNLMSNDGKFFRTKRSQEEQAKFLDVREEESNG